jgi:hypothetical protein
MPEKTSGAKQMRVRKVVTPSGKRLEKLTAVYPDIVDWATLSAAERFHLDNGQYSLRVIFLESLAAANLEPWYSPRSKAAVERAFHALQTNSLQRLS